MPTQEVLHYILPTQTSIPSTATVPVEITPSTSPEDATPHPTLTYELQDQLFTLLSNNGNCELPCYLGITPGKTLWANAERILEPYAYKTPIPYERTRITSSNVAYHAVIQTTKDINILTGVIIDVNPSNNRVTHIVSTFQFYFNEWSYFDKHLLRFSISEVFRRNGQPDVIYFVPDLKQGRGYSFSLVYEKLKMVMEYTGRIRQDVNGSYIICPNVGDGDIGAMGVYFASATDPIDVKTLVGYSFWENVSPFKDVAGMSVNDFYRLMVGNQQPICFSVKHP